jgi:hypothetical protein
MEIEIFTLCDAATVDNLNILGTFDQITAPRFPMFHRHCAVALRVRFERIEEGRHPVRISFVNADGKPVMPSLSGELGAPGGGDPPWVCQHLIVDLNNTRFEAPGLYSIDLAIDGRQERSLPLCVGLSKSVSPPAEPAV